MNVGQIAAQLYTLREFTKTPDDIRKTLIKVRDIGYRSVQVSGTGPIRPELLKEMTDEIGLKICATHTPYARLKDDLDNVIKEHLLWGCGNVGLGAMPDEYRENGREGYESFAGCFSETGKKLDSYGLRFIYHTHRFEFEKFGGVTGMDILFEKSDPRYFDFEIDTYWIQAGGADPVEWIRKVGGRMEVVHLKDMAILNNEQVFAEIGEGNLDWTRILQACRDIGVKWYAVEQDTCLRDPFKSLEMSYRYLANSEAFNE